MGVFNYVVSPRVHPLMELWQPNFVPVATRNEHAIATRCAKIRVSFLLLKARNRKARHNLKVNEKLYSKRSYEFLNCFIFLSISDLVVCLLQMEIFCSKLSPNYVSEGTESVITT